MDVCLSVLQSFFARASVGEVRKADSNFQLKTDWLHSCPWSVSVIANFAIQTTARIAVNVLRKAPIAGTGTGRTLDFAQNWRVYHQPCTKRCVKRVCDVICAEVG
jgi:hypothetical protein